MRNWSNDQWEVTTNKAPISNSAELDDLESSLKIPMPEMVFGHNLVQIKHLPTQLTLKFDPREALDEVDKTLGGKTKVLKVAYSDEWKASKIKHKKESPPQPGQLDYDVNHVHRPFDWTYTSSYSGSVTPTIDWQPVTSENEGIPYDVLRRQDPIVFFDEVELYEDELGDFGLCTYSVKIRVMPGNMFVLARFYMRVDQVAFRIRDTRIYIDFATNTIIKEHSEKEGSYESVKAKVPIWAEDFTQMLRDPRWVDSVLPLESMTVERHQLNSAAN